MADVHHRNAASTPPGADDFERCRERRRRRMESRRRRMAGGCARRRLLRPVNSSHSSSPPSSSSGEEVTVAPAAEVEVEVETTEAPEYGAMEVAGRSREMEDAVRVCMELCRPEIAGARPVHLFAVFDGHGGSHVASLCKERFHVFLREELMRPPPPPPLFSDGISGGGEIQDRRHTVAPREVVEAGWRTVMKRTFQRMDEVAITACTCGGDICTCGCGYHPASFSLTGSTATVAAVTPRHIVVANCGDSRAVLCRRGRAIPLSFDHKPDRPDELARIEAAGGRVIYMNGARVQGILAMSRAIGDKFLKPVVISEPDVTITRRDLDDECLILASDGLWDVMSNEVACKVACQCLRDRSRSHSPPPSALGNATCTERDPPMTQSSLAAALLTRLALGRDSSDNISVIVVDLKQRR